MTLSILIMDSPVGPLRITADGDAITAAEFLAPGAVVTPPDEEVSPLLDEARRQLSAYFAGDLREFDLPLAARGTTFQRRVWAELARIPYGTTTSYGRVAAELGLPMGASRAVGTANGANPIAIVVPCHRVIGANGKLVGYAGGLDRKRFLLGQEAERSGQPALFA
jgi:methylated-DNA-[protein]-cysteine S-methyltransferase